MSNVLSWGYTLRYAFRPSVPSVGAIRRVTRWLHPSSGFRHLMGVLPHPGRYPLAAVVAFHKQIRNRTVATGVPFQFPDIVSIGFSNDFMPGFFPDRRARVAFLEPELDSMEVV